MVSGIFTIPFDVPQSTSVQGRSGGSRSPVALRDYIGGPENALVLVAAASLSQVAGGEVQGRSLTNPIFLYGPKGTAKTELSYTLAATWQRSHPNRSVQVVNGLRFRRSYSTAVGRKNVRHWWTRFSENSLLCLDDIDQVAGRPATEEMLVRLIDHFVCEDRPVIITGSVHPANSTNLSSRLASRLSAGLAVQLRPPDLEARCQIFKQLASTHQIDCSSAAASYAAKHFEGSVSELNDLLAQTIATGNGKRPKITEADVRRILTKQVEAFHKVSPESIIRTVARHFQLPATQLTGSCRRHSLVRTRGIAIYLIRELAAISHQRIGHYFGGRDHSTILHAYRKTKSLVECDPDMQVAVSELLASIKNNDERRSS